MAKVFRVWSENGRVEGSAGSDDAQGNLRKEFADGRYELQNRLGGGHGSDVYRAMDQLLRRSVALKIYRAGTGPAADATFREEAQRLAWLEHPNLVTLFDAGIDAGRPYLVLQHIDGVSLADRLSQGALSLDQTVAVASRLADVLAYLHERAIVHRDVRPGSVLVDERDVYLSDFGISCAGAGIGRSDSAYLAPEQLERRPAGPAADVYSLGLVLLECLTGEPPHPESPLETVVARFARPPRIPAGLPEPLRDALEAMTAEHPAARPTAQECLAAFALCAPDAGFTGGYAGEFTGGRTAGFTGEYAGEFTDVYGRAVADEPAVDNVYEFDAARRRRRGASEAFDRTEFGAGAFRPGAVEFDDDDTQPLPLIDLTAALADAPVAGRRHRADPGRRRRWLRLATTGAVGVALAGAVMAVAEPRDTDVVRVAAPPQAAPEAAVQPPVARQDDEQEISSASSRRNVRSSAARAAAPVAPTPSPSASVSPSPSPSVAPSASPSPTVCPPALVGGVLDVVDAPVSAATGGGAIGGGTVAGGTVAGGTAGDATAAPTPSPVPSVSPTPGGTTGDPEPEPPCAA